MGKARPVEQVLADAATPPRLQARLKLTQAMMAFAERELHLPTEGQYARYTDLKRRYVVWVVFAAPPYSLEAKTWWYPLIGRQKYRGFFVEARAQREAAKLRAQGLDVFVGGVEAYSTLGYLRDPLLNTFIGRSEPDLAELLFHELTHQRLYLPGDTDFNEAFATVVGREGARRWLRAQGKRDLLARYERGLKLENAVVAEVLRTRGELALLYERSDAPQEDKEQGKAAAFERLRRRLQALGRRHGAPELLERWFRLPVNNARLNTLATYHDLVPAFEALLQDCGGDLEVFHARVEALRDLPVTERRQRLQARVRSTTERGG